MESLLLMLDAIFPLSPALKVHLLQVLKVKQLSKKDMLLKEGRICENIYFIYKGLFQCFYRVENKKVCSWFMKEGDVIVSIPSFFMQIPSYENIQALEDSEVYYISFKELEKIYTDFVEFNVNGRKLLQHYYILSEERSYTLRSRNGVSKYKFLLERYPELLQRVPAKELAFFLGMREVNFSRVKAKLCGHLQSKNAKARN